MTKLEVITKIAKKTGISREDVGLTVATLLETIKEAMRSGKEVHFRGFGSFGNKKRARKVARNIAKNTALIIEAHYAPSFNPAKAFSEKIKESVKDNL
jgi:DNA-binding protein HU-beta